MKLLEKYGNIKNQQFTALENLEDHIQKISDNNSKINAFIEINEENAINLAKNIDKKINSGEKVGKLAGMVIGIKSNINVEDFIISAASKTLTEYKGSYDATVIKRIKEEDGIILGMTNMDEFGAGSSTETSYYGPTNNPSAINHIPGGSSGGSAAAIAANMCDISLGSDTGGSIRNPSSHCGVIGFKPSYGMVSRQGLLDLSMSLDQIGPIANDVSGISMMLNTISGYDPHDCTSLNHEIPNFINVLDDSPEDIFKDMKIGIVKEFQEVSDDHIVETVNDSIGMMADMGAEIVDLSFKYIDLCLPTYYLINYVEFFSATRKYDGRKYGEIIDEVAGDEVLRRIHMGSYISQQEFSGKYYKKALQARSLIRNEITNLLKNVDILAGPTVPKLPHKIGEKLEPLEMYIYDVLTVIANLTGSPASNIKAGNVNGIPVGLQIQAKPGDDLKVIKAMHGFESLNK